MSKKTKFAIVGTSDISEKLVSAMRDCKDIEAAAVYSRTKEKAEEFARKFNIPETYTSLDELAKVSSIDAVYIASPNSLHCEQSILMMRGGKHVLCEKPIATNVEDFSRMLSIANENNVVLLEATRFFHTPGLEMIRQLLPKIGPVRRVSFLFNQYSSKYDAVKMGETPNIFSKEFAGGALMDLGIYCIELMLALFGEPKEITSSSIFVRTGVDGQGVIVAKYDGFLAELSYSKISQAATPCVIQGEEGSLLFLKASIIDKIDVVMKTGEKQQIICYTDENDMVYELKAFAEIIENPQKADIFNDYSMKAQVILDEVKNQMEKETT